MSFSQRKKISFWCSACLKNKLVNFLSGAVISHVFRVVQIGKALQDQQWLFESLMVQVEERRSAVENSAKQIEGR